MWKCVSELSHRPEHTYWRMCVNVTVQYFQLCFIIHLWGVQTTLKCKRKYICFAIRKIWHFHPKTARWQFQAPDVVNWPQAELQNTHALVERALNMAERCYWHPSDSLVFSAVVWGEIWTSFFTIAEKTVDTEDHWNNMNSVILRERDHLCLKSTCSGEDDQLCLCELQVKHFLSDLFLVVFPCSSLINSSDISFRWFLCYFTLFICLFTFYKKSWQVFRSIYCANL